MPKFGFTFLEKDVELSLYYLVINSYLFNVPHVSFFSKMISEFVLF